MIEKHLFLNICARMERLFVNAAKTTLVQYKKLIILQLHESEFSSWQQIKWVMWKSTHSGHLNIVENNLLAVKRDVS